MKLTLALALGLLIGASVSAYFGGLMLDVELFLCPAPGGLNE